MGGFVVQHRRDPPYSVCGCSDTETVCRKSFASLCEYGSGGRHPVYVAQLADPSGQSGVCGLGSISENGTSVDGDNGASGDSGASGDDGGSGSSDGVMMGGCDSLKFQHGYEVDGLSADLLGAGVCECGEGVTSGGCECGEGEGEGVVSAHYYQESEETLSVTVWYNNRVSELVVQCTYVTYLSLCLTALDCLGDTV